MTQEENLSVIEKLLGFAFVSDPRKARVPIPKAPKGHPKDRPYPLPAQEVTPEMARDILKHRVIRLDTIPKQLKHNEMTANRRFLIASLKGNSRHKGLIRTLSDGDWNPRITSPVVFTSDGFLLDGQHRLAACALSKVPIEIPITVNGQWDTFSVLDTGRGRTAGQLLDVPYADYCASTARLILPALEGTERQNWSLQDATNQDVHNLVNSWPFFHENWKDGGTWMKQVASAAASRIPLIPLAASTMMALAAGADPFLVQAFLDGLKPSHKDGFPTIGVKGSDPRFLLRRAYLRQRSSTVPVSVEKRRQVGHTRRAMQVWLEAASENPIELTKLPTVPAEGDLPEVWNVEAVREFHREVS